MAVIIVADWNVDQLPVTREDLYSPEDASSSYHSPRREALNSFIDANSLSLFLPSLMFGLMGLGQAIVTHKDRASGRFSFIDYAMGRNVFVQAHGVNDSGAWVGDNEIRSQHPGGAMALYAGGNVSFLSDQLELDLYVDKSLFGLYF